VRSFIQDGHSLVLRVIRKLVADPAVVLVVEEVHSRDWASATFVGQLHRMDCKLKGSFEAVQAAAQRLRDELPESDADGSERLFLADASVTALRMTGRRDGRATASLSIEALTLLA